MISRISKPIVWICITMACMLIATIISRVIYNHNEQSIWFTLYVTFLTIFYHFAMRILVGETVTLLSKHREFHYDCIWYKTHSVEANFYKLIKVKSWKLKMITAKPEQFDIRQRSLEELLHNMTQAEIVHEIIMVLSFAPVVLIIPYGAPAVFVITSTIACMMDFMFVIIQRYNRPRVLKVKMHLDQ